MRTENLQHRMLVEMGLDEHDKFRVAASGALCLDAGLRTTNKAAGAEVLRGSSLMSLARKSLALDGVTLPSDDDWGVATRALTSSDFTAILNDVAHTHLLEGYEQSFETWQDWVGIGELADFKQATLSQFEAGDLEEVSGEFEFGKLSDKGEPAQLLTYGKIFAVSRKAIIFNDKRVFTKVPQRIGESASRKVGDLCYSVLIANAAMSDGTTLFHADHSNIGTGGAPSDTTIGEGVKLMKKQTRIDSTKPAGIPPRYFMAPVALESVAEKVFRTLQGDTDKIKRIYDARLDAESETAWYMAAEKGLAVVVYFLDGNMKPHLEYKAGYPMDWMEFKVRLDVTAAATDHRSLLYNAGA